MNNRLLHTMAMAMSIFPMALLSRCQSVDYYGQAIKGQYRILQNRQPINRIIDDPQTPPFLRKKLAYVLEVRRFARDALQLPVGDNFLTYVDLKRKFVAWNVFAAPVLSLVPKTWCYPLVGCAAYRGYFSQADARRYAEALSRQGYDVYVGGVSAYSTLGWFNDPILSNFMRLSDCRLAALIFHELAHRIFYVADDTTFNESFATTVEQEGLRRWQKVRDNTHPCRQYGEPQRRQHRFSQLILKYRHYLQRLYATNLPAAEKKVRKRRVFQQLRHEYEMLKKKHKQLAVYDHWMQQPLNNAQIISVAAYHDLVPAFENLLAALGGNLPAFYRTCRQLAEKPKKSRLKILNTYMPGIPAVDQWAWEKPTSGLNLDSTAQFL